MTTKITLDDSQQKAVNGILKGNNRMAILCGGGGFGKSTVIENITVEAREVYGIPASEIFFCATTGKAAKVLQENIEDLELPNKAMTIHRMLGCRGAEWEYSSKNQLKASLVFVDESSMLDSALFARVLSAISPDATIVFVGDPAQLNPVGAGCPFNDVVNSKQTQHLVHELKVCWRQKQGSLIADASQQCRAGRALTWGKQGEHTLGGALEDDLFLHKTDSDYNDDSEARHAQILAKTYEISKPWFDGGEDYIVLSPQHSTGIGITAMNEYLQEMLNPLTKKLPFIEVGSFKFRVGDRVKQTKNNYDLEVFNGYVGSITALSGDGVIVDYSGKQYHYPSKESMFNLILGYCVSVHSSQGSGYEYGVIIADKSHSFMLNRQLVYVALSRFKKECHVIGQKKTIARAIRNNSQFSRSTYLGEQLYRSDTDGGVEDE